MGEIHEFFVLAVFLVWFARATPENRSLVDVSDIFHFFCLGEGKGESEAPGGEGDIFLLKIPGRVVSRAGGADWGGGVNFFFRGRNSYQDEKKQSFAETACPF